MQERIEAHMRFWNGEGPCLIQIPTAGLPKYYLDGYEVRFRDPEAMWESEMARARPTADWPTDGVPTVRPNLGVIFIPSMAGLPYQVRSDQMPWPGEPLEREAIRAARGVDVAQADLMRLAAEFYAIHRERSDGTVFAHHADTQGVFDIAHLLYGDDIFYDIADRDEQGWAEELMDICRGLYVDATAHLKGLLGEDASSMIHGHGGPQGIYYPGAGARMAEDTATLLSPATIERFVIPAIQEAAEPFGGAFLHFCGWHEALFEALCRLECVRAIDLGNPESYELRWLLERCAESGTVLRSQIAPRDGETWEVYVRRIAGLVRETGARCILEPLIAPKERDECAAMRELWHELTA